MASSANTSKTMHISLERKCTDLESQLSVKQKSLDFAEEKLKDIEENMALVIYEKEKPSSKLISFRNANEDLKAQLRSFEKKLKETEKDLVVKYKVAADEVEYYKSSGYTTKIIEIFHASSEYQDELFDKSNTFFDRGCAHILFQFH